MFFAYMPKISEIQKSDIPAAMRMVEASFREFLGKELKAEGVGIFLGLLDVRNFSHRLADGNKSYIAKEGEAILGLIEIRNKNHILLLFVDKDSQGKGIGGLLVQHYLKNEKWDADEVVTVNAALGSSGFYKSVGFREKEDWKIKSGIEFLRMERMAI